MGIPAFPKIFTIGDRNTANLFDDPVEITEKIDGSAFSFGVIDHVLHMRSKNKPVFLNDGNKMFTKAAEVVTELFVQGGLRDGCIYQGEYLQKPKHNTLAYSRTPNNHIMLYAMLKPDGTYADYTSLEVVAGHLGMEPVPLLYRGTLMDAPGRLDYLKGLMERESVLGGATAEGIVVKNYHQQIIIGGQVLPLIAGKYVSEQFKEKHKVDWKAANPSDAEKLAEALKSPARWTKTIHRMRDEGVLDQSPRDIGPAIKLIQEDIINEEKEWIKDVLWNMKKREILQIALWGFPEWYKDQLVEGTFA